MRRSIVTLLLVGALVWTQQAFAWTNLGIYGGTINDVAIDPSNPDKIFAGAHHGAGLYVSTDGGSLWQPVEMGLSGTSGETFQGHTVYDVAIAPSNPDIVWVAHNHWVAKSTDGGQSWTSIMNSTMQRSCTDCGGDDDTYRLCLSIAIDPQFPDVVYVGTGGPSSSDTNGAIYKTEDGGSTWTKLNGGGNFDFGVADLAIAAQNPDLVWAVTSSDGYEGEWTGTLYSSRNAGNTWAPIEVALDPPHGSYQGVAIKPDNPDVIYSTCSRGIIRSTYEDDEWQHAYVLSGDIIAYDIVFAPSDAETAYACWYYPRSYGGNDAASISVSHDGGLTWQSQSLDVPYISQLTSLAVHPGNAARLYGGDFGLGVLHSLNEGQTWTPTTNGIDAIVVYDVDVDPNNSDHMIAASGSGVFERRPNEGWQCRLKGSSRSVRFDPDTGDRFYAGQFGFVLKTEDSGLNWSSSSELPQRWIYAIDIDPDATDTVYITTNHDGGSGGGLVMRSMDGGTNFVSVLEGRNQEDQAYAMNCLTIDPNDYQHILAGGGNFYSPSVAGDLWESSDGGDSWQRTALTNVIVNSVLIDPRDSDILYAGCGHDYNYYVPLNKSLDGGATWQEAATGMPNSRMGFYAIWGESADEIFAVGSFGYIIHYDGNSWQSQYGDSYNNSSFNTLYGVMGASASDVFAVGRYGTILHYDGQAWTPMESGTGEHIYDVWVADSDHAYAVCSGGVILHYDGAAWSEMTSPTSGWLSAIEGTSINNIYAAGQNGEILHYDGSTWSTMTSGTTQGLYDLWSAGPSDIFASGNNGTVLHFDGTVWSTMTSNVTGPLWGISGSGPSDVYATGWQGDLIHFDGDQWSVLSDHPASDYFNLWATASNQVFIGNYFGGLWLFNGQEWATIRAPGNNRRSVTDLDFHPTNPDILYASTFEAGIFISPNQAGNWLDLGTPPSSVYALSTGSLYAATGSGVYQLTGTGVIAGQVRDAITIQGIDGATVSTDLGSQCRSVLGEYMMVVPAGIFDLYTVADGYAMASVNDITVTGSDVTWQNIDMTTGTQSEPPPGEPSGGGGGGGYCFIHSTGWDGLRQEMGGLSYALLACIGLVAGFRFRKSFFFSFALMAFIGLLAPTSGQSATLFQQVGVASPPAPVGSGARAMAMGGAFIAIADDATAASWNPAGLIQLERPELSIVGAYADRHADYTSDSNPEINNNSSDGEAGLNYFSFTYPVAWTRNLVLSINYQRLYDFERSFSYPFNYSDSGLDLEQDISYDQNGQVGAVGLAGAIELTPDIAMGLTMNVWTDELGWDNGWEEHYRSHATGSQGGVPVTIDTVIEDRYEKFRGINFNLGLLWETPHWGRFGAVVKTPFTATIAHTFELNETTVYGPPVNSTTRNGPIITKEEVELEMPLSYGVGWALRMGDALTVSADIHRTHWEDYILTDGQGNSFSPISGLPEAQSDINATTHVRIGGEYVIPSQRHQAAFSIRGGLFYDPEPSQGGAQDYYGFSLGGGVAWQRASLDLAYQLRWGPDVETGNLIATSEADTTQHNLMVSLIYYF